MRETDLPIISFKSGNIIKNVIANNEEINSEYFTNTDSLNGHQLEQGIEAVTSPTDLTTKLKSCSNTVCSQAVRKIYFGIWVTICITASWVGATHCIKYLFIRRSLIEVDTEVVLDNFEKTENNITSDQWKYDVPYQAPFFTTWFMTNWTVLFFPLFFISRLSTKRCESMGSILLEYIRDFRERGYTVGRFLLRCSFFCILWVGTNYMYILSLQFLFATDVMTLFSTNVSFMYLLSWVILHEQFVGIRIIAVIVCDTGVALLAYMDGISGSSTLSGVVLASSSSACSAIYKVLFKKIIGDSTYGQVALIFSIIGILNALFLWPLSLLLILAGEESLPFDDLPWASLLSASCLTLVANLLGNFSIALTYDLFITLGLITAVPVSAALDVVLYGATFEGMKLGGMILIGIGFFLVMFPHNWPDYITRLLRSIIKLTSSASKPSYREDESVRK
ncbi:hypothetical protein WA026_010061 [Henosepilachna vigintioctopunctata]|uniref:Thiamine transporter SLC35F3 n=1 Tax=Henosepilachna vigintioctopunctata TaxID=420089 RepID=A0AAW1UB45_9CUCU